MEKKYFKQESRKEWFRDDDFQITNDELKLGALLRIADATELMAQNYNKLQSDLAWSEKRLKELKESYERICRSNIALRGHVTRLKTKLKFALL
jgi:hypothetical protein